MLFKRLLMGAAITCSIGYSDFVRADEFTPTDTVFLDSEPLGRMSMLFKVKDRLVVVNQVDGKSVSSITVYSEQGLLLERKIFNFGIEGLPYLGPDQAVYLAGEKGQFVRFGVVDTVRWEKLMPPPVDPTNSSFSMVNDTVYVALPSSRQVMALSKADGSLKWITTLPFSGWIYDLTVVGDDLRVISSHGERKIGFYALNTATGDIRISNYYTSNVETASRVRAILRTNTNLLVSVADTAWNHRILKLDLDGRILQEIPSSSICSIGSPKGFINVFDRFYASCADNHSFETLFVELGDEGNVLRELGTVGTYMDGTYFNFGKKVVFKGGHFNQDYGVTKFVFSDGVNLSPMRTVWGNHYDIRIQKFAFDEYSENAELAVLSYDSEKQQQFVKLFDAN